VVNQFFLAVSSHTLSIFFPRLNKDFGKFYPELELVSVFQKKKKKKCVSIFRKNISGVHLEPENKI